VEVVVDNEEIEDGTKWHFEIIVRRIVNGRNSRNRESRQELRRMHPIICLRLGSS
jgi:hypothetical protein